MCSSQYFKEAKERNYDDLLIKYDLEALIDRHRKELKEDYQSGYDDGYDDGYDEGYEDGSVAGYNNN